MFWSPGCSTIPLCSLVSCQLCLCVTGCLMVHRLLCVIHRKQLGLAKKKKPKQKHTSVRSSGSETAEFAGRTFKAALVRLQRQPMIVCGGALTSEMANSFIINILSPIRRRRSCRFRHCFHANSCTSPATHPTRGCYIGGSSTL